MLWESRSPSRSWEQGWAPRRGHLWPRSGRLSAEISLTGEEKKKITTQNPKKSGNISVLSDCREVFFFPGAFRPEALREGAGGVGHLQRAGEGIHRGFCCPKLLQHSQNEPAEP